VAGGGGLGRTTGGRVHVSGQEEGAPQLTTSQTTIEPSCIFFIIISIRDIQRLPTIPFSLVMRNEYFDWPSLTLHLKDGGEGTQYFVVLQL
jgi:hypothetical protein